MRRLFFVISMLSLMAVILSWIACDSNDPVSTSDEYELTRFIVDSEDGKELYTIELFPDAPFYINDNTEIYYRFDSNTRVIDIDYGASGTNFYGYDNIPVADVNVIDAYYGEAYKIVDGDTTERYPLVNNVTRMAYFLKLYDDSYNYRGWRFWGYATASIDPPGNFAVLSGPTFSTDPPETLNVTPRWVYFEKNQITALSAGDSITFNCNSAANIMTLNSSGDIVGFGTTPQGGDHITGWRLPTTSRFYQLIMVDMPWNYTFDTTFISLDPLIVTVDTSINKSADPIIPYKAAF